MKASPLYIPKAKKWKGLTVYCYKCKTNMTDICNETGKPLQRCPFGDKHAFKVYMHVPGTDNARKTKKLETRDVNEAIKQAMEFEKEVKGYYTNGNTGENIKESKTVTEQTPILLIHALARYIGWLHNEGVPAHRKRQRSEHYIGDIKRSFTLLTHCLKKNGYDLSSFTVNQINDTVVGQIYDYLQNEKGYANRTFNKYFSYYTSFLKCHSEEYNQPIRNWFERVKRKKVFADPRAITKEEFEALLKQLSPENGIKK